MPGPAGSPWRRLTPEQVAAFQRDGVVVVPGLVSSDAVQDVRAALRTFLADRGVDLADPAPTVARVGGALGGFIEVRAWPPSRYPRGPILLTGAMCGLPPGAGAAKCFHSDAQCRVRELSALYDAWVDLYAATWATAEGLYAHPFGPFDPTRLVFYYDRLCHRWPDRVFAMRAALPAAFGVAKPSAVAADSAGPKPGTRRRTWKPSVEDDTPPTGAPQKGTGRNYALRSGRGQAFAHPSCHGFFA